MNGSQINHNPALADTFRRVFAHNVFGCSGPRMHVHFAKSLHKSPAGYSCPQCGAPVNDITEAPVGQAYFAFGRPDLAKTQ